MKIKPYSKSNVSMLWTDPYIAKKMLEYNLQTDNDLVSRNSDVVKKSIKFITKKYKLGKDTTLCDLGCGAGMYTDLFQQQGIDVTGIDISSHSIEYAKHQNKNVNYINADYLNLDIDKQFDFITMIYCDLVTLTDNDRGVLLDNVNEMLNDDGLFMFDVWNHKFYDEVPPTDTKYTEVDGFYMSGKSRVTKRNYKYDDLHLILTKTTAKGQHKKIDVNIWDKFFNVTEITELVNAHGLEVVDLYSNTYGEKYTKDSYCITVVCKKGD